MFFLTFSEVLFAVIVLATFRSLLQLLDGFFKLYALKREVAPAADAYGAHIASYAENAKQGGAAWVLFL